MNEVSLTEKMTKEVKSIRSLALIVTFTGLVFLSTSIFYLNIASSTGFFNIGEAFVYIAAFIGGPITGAISGGVGAALADLALGYGIYAPATLILKALEGFTVGLLFLLSKRLKQKVANKAKIIIESVSVLGLSAFLITFSAIYSKETFTVETSFYGASGPDKVYSLTIPGYVLLILAIILSLLMALAILISILKSNDIGVMVLSCAIGGIFIVVGYFIYQAFVIGVGVAGAAVEIPFNIAQVFFGTAIAMPLVSYLRDLGILKSEDKEAEEQNLEKTTEK